jgi:hypothetical protein
MDGQIDPLIDRRAYLQGCLDILERVPSLINSFIRGQEKRNLKQRVLPNPPGRLTGGKQTASDAERILEKKDETP